MDGFSNIDGLLWKGGIYMQNNYSLNYDLFIRKIFMIGYYRKNCELSYEEIAYIVKSEKMIIKTYCNYLLHLN